MDDLLQAVVECMMDARESVRREAVVGAGDTVEVMLDALAARRADPNAHIAEAAEQQLDRLYHHLLEISRR